MTKNKRKGGGGNLSVGEKDVLMGRGKRVSEWPGNVHFRQVINKYRDQYLEAERSAKVEIAQHVISDVHKIGGRFLKEESDGSWTEVALARAVEKTCQALREKEKANPPAQSPFVGDDAPPSKRPKLSPAKRKPPPPRLAGRASKLESDDNESMVSGSTTDSDDDDEDSASTSSEETETDNETGEQKDGTAGPIQMKTWSQNELLERLQKFQTAHGHCAVPPGFPEDAALADWCCAQRQLHREIQTGYRKASENEQSLLDRLQEVGFCWDYEEWHWNRRLQELEERQKENEGKKDVKEYRLPTPKTLQWLQDQRHQYHTEGHWHVPTWRMEKLKALGISL